MPVVRKIVQHKRLIAWAFSFCMIHRTKSQERLGGAYILYEESYKMTPFYRLMYSVSSIKNFGRLHSNVFRFFELANMLCAQTAVRRELTDSLCCETRGCAHARKSGTQRAHGFAVLRGNLQAAPCCEARGCAHAFKLRCLPGPCGCVVMPVKLQHIRRFTIAVIIAALEGRRHIG